MSAPPQDISKSELLRELGYGGEVSLYDAAMQAAGLSNPKKPRIAIAKRAAVADLLAAGFMRVCSRGDCTNRAPSIAGGRIVVPAATQADCEVCCGSVNRGGIDEMIAAFGRNGWKRLCIVGGNPSTREDLQRLAGSRLDLRLIDGTRSRNQADADADCTWADLVVLWGSTELAHKVSERYKGKNVITCPRRGLAELAKEATTAAARFNSR
jgi:hypothetical protein